MFSLWCRLGVAALTEDQGEVCCAEDLEEELYNSYNRSFTNADVISLVWLGIIVDTVAVLELDTGYRRPADDCDQVEDPGDVGESVDKDWVAPFSAEA